MDLQLIRALLLSVDDVSVSSPPRFHGYDREDIKAHIYILRYAGLIEFNVFPNQGVRLTPRGRVYRTQLELNYLSDYVDECLQKRLNGAVNDIERSLPEACFTQRLSVMTEMESVVPMTEPTPEEAARVLAA